MQNITALGAGYMGSITFPLSDNGNKVVSGGRGLTMK